MTHNSKIHKMMIVMRGNAKKMTDIAEEMMDEMGMEEMADGKEVASDEEHAAIGFKTMAKRKMKGKMKGMGYAG